jgi:hypothetical protein
MKIRFYERQERVNLKNLIGIPQGSIVGVLHSGHFIHIGFFENALLMWEPIEGPLSPERRPV